MAVVYVAYIANEVNYIRIGSYRQCVKDSMSSRLELLVDERLILLMGENLNFRSCEYCK